MKLDDKTNGFITIDDYIFSFCLDNNLLYGNYIKGKKGITSVKEKGNFSFIEAVHSGTGAIYFYNLSYHYNFFNNTLNGKCYAVFLPKLINAKVDCFDCISIKGRIINNIFPPSLGVEEKIDYDNFGKNGTKEIRIKPFSEKTSETDVVIFGEKIKISCTICSPGGIGEDDTNLGKIYTSFRLYFENRILMKDLLKWINSVKKLFSFLYFRNDVTFEQVELFNNSKYGYDKVGNVYLFDDFENDIPQKSINCIKFPLIKDHLNSLFNVLLNEEIQILCFPNNKKDSYIVNPEKYVFTCSTFESLFLQYYPNFSSEDTDFINVKQGVINYLETEDIKYKGINKNARRWINKIKDTIERESVNLNHKFNKCYVEFNEIIEAFKNNIKSRYNKNPDDLDLGEAFSSVRNGNAHGGNVEYNENSIIAFEFGRVFIYIMILKMAVFTKEEIIEFIRVLFISI